MTIGKVLEAPIPIKSGVIKKKVSLVKHRFVHAPWNCRSTETQARGTHTHTYYCRRPATPGCRRSRSRCSDSLRLINIYIYIYICIGRERERDVHT